METILAVIVGVLVAHGGFFLGTWAGIKMRESEQKLKGHTTKPTKVEIATKAEKQAAEEEKRKLDTIIENIENYDGTSYGQKDV